MRTYGRVTDQSGRRTWVEVATDTGGLNDRVYMTTLIQVLKLNLGESPFYANYGIPAQASIAQQIYPDFYVALTQRLFAQYFANLIITRRQGLSPVYDVRITTQQGVVLTTSVPIAT